MLSTQTKKELYEQWYHEEVSHILLKAYIKIEEGKVIIQGWEIMFGHLIDDLIEPTIRKYIPKDSKDGLYTLYGLFPIIYYEDDCVDRIDEPEHFNFDLFDN